MLFSRNIELAVPTMKALSMHKLFVLLALVAASASAAPPTPDQAAVLGRISTDSLRGNLSFLASDVLEGRGTPSRGLDVAAEYIAAQYRRAGLEPLGDDGYFQTANWTYTEPNLAGFAFQLRHGQQALALAPKQFSFKPGAALEVRAAAVVKADWNDLGKLEALGAAVAGKVVMVELPLGKPTTQAEYDAIMANRKAGLARIQALKPLLVLALDRNRPAGDGGGRGQLSDPAQPTDTPAPYLAVHGEPATQLFNGWPTGLTGATLDLTLGPAIVKPVKLRNVAAVLRGSDPALKDTYVILSAHYDHLGIRPDMPGDHIFNGANDNGSGTATVLEVASAMAAMTSRPRRSVLFLNVFGEELGMLGSGYYGRNPLVPVARTVANLNLEQLGRTDGKDGSGAGKAQLTGFDFSTLPATIAAAGAATGIVVSKDPLLSDKYFAQSDNVAMARLGVPAHTLSVLYEFPEYHKVGDHWQKIDFDNLAKVSRMVALGVIMLANDPAAPRWNEAVPAVAPYLKAHKALTK